jgi:hypothetical protein
MKVKRGFDFRNEAFCVIQTGSGGRLDDFFLDIIIGGFIELPRSRAARYQIPLSFGHPPC